MYFIRCPRHSPTKMMFYIKILMASSSMTNVEEEADDREISRRPKLSYRGERGQLQHVRSAKEPQYPVQKNMEERYKEKKMLQKTTTFNFVVYVYYLFIVYAGHL